ncbi:hypothetical protein [Mycobacterium tuberculosis]|uniref:hypothetical protein n=1 Tax=Mycobacterium tuberculosis TaxID=1773 RepID=UPI002711F00D|nr:hypothetical protein [Mycobacterium tuberculosis]
MSDAQDSRVGSMFGPYHPGRFEGSRDDRPLLGYDTPTGLTCPYTTPLDVTRWDGWGWGN